MKIPRGALLLLILVGGIGNASARKAPDALEDKGENEFYEKISEVLEKSQTARDDSDGINASRAALYPPAIRDSKPINASRAALYSQDSEKSQPISASRAVLYSQNSEQTQPIDASRAVLNSQTSENNPNAPHSQTSENASNRAVLYSQTSENDPNAAVRSQTSENSPNAVVRSQTSENSPNAVEVKEAKESKNRHIYKRKIFTPASPERPAPEGAVSAVQPEPRSRSSPPEGFLCQVVPATGLGRLPVLRGVPGAVVPGHRVLTLGHRLGRRGRDDPDLYDRERSSEKTIAGLEDAPEPGGEAPGLRHVGVERKVAGPHGKALADQDCGKGDRLGNSGSASSGSGAR